MPEKPDVAGTLAEYAVAAASAASFYLLKPVSLLDDEIASQMDWARDRDWLEGIARTVFPDRSEHGAGSLGKVPWLPRQQAVPDGVAEAIRRYYFFEFFARPSDACTVPTLAALSAALRNRSITEGSSLVCGLGPLVMGPLGVITSWNKGWLPAPADLVRPEESLAGCLAGLAFCDRDASIDVAVEDLRTRTAMRSWSTRWQKWFWARSRAAEDVDGGSRVVLAEGAREWAPKAKTLPQRLQERACVLMELASEEQSRTLLEVCLTHRRSEFFSCGFDHAPDALRALSSAEARTTLGHGEVWQLLGVAPPETVFSAARELNLFDEHVLAYSRKRSFAENLVRALVDVGKELNDDELSHFFGHAGGDEYDQLLHYVIRQDPCKVLRIQLGRPRVAALLARRTFSPLRFHHLDGWDPTDPVAQSELESSVGAGLGEQLLPPVPKIAQPLEDLAAGISSAELFARVVEGRRRSEWVLKCATQYLYRVFRARVDRNASEQLDWAAAVLSGKEVAHAEKPASASCDPSAPFWTDPRISGRMAGTSGAKTPAGKLTLSQIVDANARLRKLIGVGVPAYLTEIMDAQKALIAEFEQLGVGAAGNLASHDNDASAEDLRQAFSRQLAFDRFARSTPGAMPEFVSLVARYQAVNAPVRITVSPVLALGVKVRKVEHFFSRGSRISVPGGEVISLTDVTRNSISINPIVLAWTDWLRGSPAKS